MSVYRLTAFVLGMYCALPAVASALEAQGPVMVSTVSYTDVLRWMLGLVFVLVIFGGLAWLLRKASGFSINQKSQLAVISGLSLGMREKLVLVKVGEKQLLLGVTPGRVDKLMELEGEARLFLEQADDDMFSKKLQATLQGRTNA